MISSYPRNLLIKALACVIPFTEITESLCLSILPLFIILIAFGYRNPSLPSPLRALHFLFKIVLQLMGGIFIKKQFFLIDFFLGYRVSALNLLTQTE